MPKLDNTQHLPTLIIAGTPEHRRAEMQQLIDDARPLAITLERGTAGIYVYASGSIYIDLNKHYNARQVAMTFVHECAHRAVRRHGRVAVSDTGHGKAFAAVCHSMQMYYFGTAEALEGYNTDGQRLPSDYVQRVQSSGQHYKSAATLDIASVVESEAVPWRLLLVPLIAASLILCVLYLHSTGKLPGIVGAIRDFWNSPLRPWTGIAITAAIIKHAFNSAK